MVDSSDYFYITTILFTVFHHIINSADIIIFIKCYRFLLYHHEFIFFSSYFCFASSNELDFLHHFFSLQYHCQSNKFFSSIALLIDVSSFLANILTTSVPLLHVYKWINNNNQTTALIRHDFTIGNVWS